MALQRLRNAEFRSGNDVTRSLPLNLRRERLVPRQGGERLTLVLWTQKMVCPLRYVVAAVSLVVALVVLFWNTAEMESGRKRLLHGGKDGNKGWRWWDLFTGRLLYELWVEVRAAQVVPSSCGEACAPMRAQATSVASPQ